MSASMTMKAMKATQAIKASKAANKDAMTAMKTMKSMKSMKSVKLNDMQTTMEPTKSGKMSMKTTMKAMKSMKSVKLNDMQTTMKAMKSKKAPKSGKMSMKTTMKAMKSKKAPMTHAAIMQAIQKLAEKATAQAKKKGRQAKGDKSAAGTKTYQLDTQGVGHILVDVSADGKVKELWMKEKNMYFSATKKSNFQWVPDVKSFAYTVLNAM
jgi:hypothetical protein